jgi:hypothetical protein
MHRVQALVARPVRCAHVRCSMSCHKIYFQCVVCASATSMVCSTAGSLGVPAQAGVAPVLPAMRIYSMSPHCFVLHGHAVAAHGPGAICGMSTELHSVCALAALRATRKHDVRMRASMTLLCSASASATASAAMAYHLLLSRRSVPVCKR